MLTLFSQQDPRWAKMKLGESPCTVGRYGCTSVCITIGRNWLLKGDLNPGQIIPKLSYTKDGLILWGSLAKIGLKLNLRAYTRNDSTIQKALEAENAVCLLEVNHNHWLFLIGRKLPFLGYRVIDPWRGDKCYTSRYGNNITGFAVISRL